MSLLPFHKEYVGAKLSRRKGEENRQEIHPDRSGGWHWSVETQHSKNRSPLICAFALIAHSHQSRYLALAFQVSSMCLATEAASVLPWMSSCHWEVISVAITLPFWDQLVQ